MKRDLVVIESPNKIKTLKKYLGDKFEVLATVGHIRELSPRSGFDKDYKPKWTISRGRDLDGKKTKKEIIAEIKKAAVKAENIYLASDPDREGEAIAWHVCQILGVDERKKCKRITFNEISQSAVSKALENPREIDMDWVSAQFARCLLDQMIGFRLSKIVQNTLHADSAGRVQSVALKFLQEREHEIEDFVEQKWWTLDVLLSNGTPLTLYSLNRKLISDDEQKLVEQATENAVVNFIDKSVAKKVQDHLSKEFKVFEVSQPKKSSINPKELYRTSTLQQDGINRLGWTSRRITSIAQKLYEGLEIDGDYRALITYPRTDSVRVSVKFAAQAQKFVLDHFGSNYVGNYDPSKQPKNKDIKIQDAHEAIRPIDLDVTPESIQTKVDSMCYKLYKLIWTRTVAAFMAPAIFSRINVYFTNQDCKFFAINRERKFDGYQKIYDDNHEDEETSSIPLEDFIVGKVFASKKQEIKEHKTLPPARFNQASLIAALEKAGIGRPSTYNTMANVAVDRGYADLKNRHYVITELGKKVSAELEEHFSNIINKDFTRRMEENLDKIADGEKNYQDYLNEFWPKFNSESQSVYEQIKKEVEKTGKLCPEDGGELVYRYARKSKTKFIGCSNYPKCKYHAWLEVKEKPLELDRICPKCNQSKLVQRTGRDGKFFIACSGFPKCRYTESIAQTKQNATKETAQGTLIPKGSRKKLK